MHPFIQAALAKQSAIDRRNDAENARRPPRRAASRAADDAAIPRHGWAHRILALTRPWTQ